jgi:hypothetical protein
VGEPHRIAGGRTVKAHQGIAPGSNDEYVVAYSVAKWYIEEAQKQPQDMGRPIIIGDIRGCYRELLRLLDKVSASESDTVFALGDIIDRGPDSINLFRNRQSFEGFIDNHERKPITGYFSYAQEMAKRPLGTLMFASTSQSCEPKIVNQNALGFGFELPAHGSMEREHHPGDGCKSQLFWMKVIAVLTNCKALEPGCHSSSGSFRAPSFLVGKK